MANITIKIAELAKPLKTTQCAKGTTLEQFLDKRGMRYSSSIRVNGNVASRGSTLHAGDIIISIGSVSGGC